MAVQLKSQGWKAIKLRAHYPTLKEDVQLVEAVRKAVGDDPAAAYAEKPGMVPSAS